jgi:hypothetical protein
MQKVEHVLEAEFQPPQGLGKHFSFDSSARIARFDFEEIDTVDDEQQRFLLDLFERPDVVRMLQAAQISREAHVPPPNPPTPLPSPPLDCPCQRVIICAPIASMDVAVCSLSLRPPGVPQVQIVCACGQRRVR